MTYSDAILGRGREDLRWDYELAIFRLNADEEDRLYIAGRQAHLAYETAAGARREARRHRNQHIAWVIAVAVLALTLGIVTAYVVMPRTEDVRKEFVTPGA